MSDLAMIPFVKSVWNWPITSIILHYKTMGPFYESGEGSWFFSECGEVVGSSLLTPPHYNFSIGVIILFAIE